MQWQRCSRTGSRKSRGRPLAAILLVVVSGIATAQIQHTAAIRSSDTYLTVTIAVAGADIDELFSVLEDDMTARLDYRIRLSHPRRAPFRLLGDRLEREFRPSHEVRWDPFGSAYVLTSHDGTTAAYSDEATLYARLFSLESYRIPWSAIRDEPGLVVEISVQYTPIVFVPGLSILTLFTANRSEHSPWSRHVVDRTEGQR